MSEPLQIVDETTTVTARHRKLTNGWVRSENLDYDAEVAASAEPWFVPKTVWTAYVPEKPPIDFRAYGFGIRPGQPERWGTRQIRKCYDGRPGIERWVYRCYQRRERTTMPPTDAEWVACTRRPFMWTLAEARGRG